MNQAARKISGLVDQGYLDEEDKDKLLFELDQLREMHREMCRISDTLEDGIAHLAGGNYLYWTGRPQFADYVDK